MTHEAVSLRHGWLTYSGVDNETWGDKKKPWRYRWPEEVHDEVLARLLDLNQKRAEQERLSGAAAQPKSKAKRGKSTGEGTGTTSTGKGKRGGRGKPASTETTVGA